MQENPCVDWNKLERNVKKAIKNDCPNNLFDSKELEECEYMQKVAEVERSKIDGLLAVSIFVISGGAGFALASFSYVPLAILGFVLLFSGIIPFYIWHLRSPKCYEIILDAEKKIQSENIKKRNTENVEKGTQ